MFAVVTQFLPGRSKCDRLDNLSHGRYFASNQNEYRLAFCSLNRRLIV